MLPIWFEAAKYVDRRLQLTPEQLLDQWVAEAPPGGEEQRDIVRAAILQQQGHRLHLDGIKFRTLPPLDQFGITALLISRNPLLQDPPDLRFCKSLSELTITDCEQKNPPNICQLTSLQRLNLSHNEYKTIPQGLDRHPTLERLDLSVNPLGQLPEFRCDRLQQLEASRCELIHAPDLSRLPSLEHIHIARNRFAVPAKLPASTQYLDISRNRLTVLPDYSHLTNLIALDARFNDIARLPDSFFLHEPAPNGLASSEAHTAHARANQFNSPAFAQRVDLCGNPLLEPIAWSRLESGWSTALAVTCTQRSDGLTEGTLVEEADAWITSHPHHSLEQQQHLRSALQGALHEAGAQSFAEWLYSLRHTARFAHGETSRTDLMGRVYSVLEAVAFDPEARARAFSMVHSKLSDTESTESTETGIEDWVAFEHGTQAILLDLESEMLAKRSRDKASVWRLGRERYQLERLHLLTQESEFRLDAAITLELQLRDLLPGAASARARVPLSREDSPEWIRFMAGQNFWRQSLRGDVNVESAVKQLTSHLPPEDGDADQLAQELYEALTAAYAHDVLPSAITVLQQVDGPQTLMQMHRDARTSQSLAQALNRFHRAGDGRVPGDHTSTDRAALRERVEVRSALVQLTDALGRQEQYADDLQAALGDTAKPQSIERLRQAIRTHHESLTRDLFEALEAAEAHQCLTPALALLRDPDGLQRLTRIHQQGWSQDDIEQLRTGLESATLADNAESEDAGSSALTLNRSGESSSGPAPVSLREAVRGVAQSSWTRALLAARPTAGAFLSRVALPGGMGIAHMAEGLNSISRTVPNEIVQDIERRVRIHWTLANGMDPDSDFANRPRLRAAIDSVIQNAVSRIIAGEVNLRVSTVRTEAHQTGLRELIESTEHADFESQGEAGRDEVAASSSEGPKREESATAQTGSQRAGRSRVLERS